MKYANTNNINNIINNTITHTINMYTSPDAPLGTPSHQEQKYYESCHIIEMGRVSIRGPCTYIEKMMVPTAKGEKEAYVYQVGYIIVALDCVVQCLWNVGSDKNNWYFSNISTEPPNYEKHVKMMVNACPGFLTESVYNASCTEWLR